ncbi:MAG TPA: hypothetical protein DCL95_06220, partial [Rhodospirillaceae bacterium]|nr:hypothetical protein [Rhodospirillaceae bacterium]
LATQGGRLAETGVIARPFTKSPRGEGASRRVRLVFRRTSPRLQLMLALSEAITDDLPPLVHAVPKEE